ncbi:MAG: SUMF1/EgtB/PvdO family nonheme iron enzyme [Bacteroidia bacterium]
MNYELIHDTIAKQIYQKASTEARTRRKVEKYIRERYEAYQSRGARLTQDDIDYITPYLSQVNITQEEETFVEDERKALIAAKRRQRMIVIGVIALLVLFLGFALERWVDANAKTKLANEKTREAVKSDSLAQIEKKKAVKSDSLAKIALVDALRSDSLAQIEKEKAQQNLANFQKATESIVASVLEDAQQDIYKLLYADALKKYRDAYQLKKLPNEVAKGMMELAFFYHETGQPQLARDLADTTALLLEKRSQMRGAEDFLARLKRIQPDWYEEIHNRYYPKMIFVEGGAFTYQKGEEGEKDTTLSDFYIGEMEVTVWQYNLYALAVDSIDMAEKPSWGYDGDNPVVYVSWYDTKKYADWLSAKTGDSYQLPGEVEWEYAARGGKKSRGYIYSGSDTLDDVGWYGDNSESRTNPVKKKMANELGLYDMSGNVWEWCEDWYNSERGFRVIRGGSWFSLANYAKVTFRYGSSPDSHCLSAGFGPINFLSFIFFTF